MSIKEKIELRNIKSEDLPIFYHQQLDPEANQMAAFTVKDPSDREAFNQHWKKIMNDTSVLTKTILYNGEIAGHLGFFNLLGLPSISYWIGKNYWNNGVATSALMEFVKEISERPIYARVAVHNKASIRVLEKCGFVQVEIDHGFADYLQREVEEFVMKLSN